MTSVPVATFTATDPEAGTSIVWSLTSDAIGDVIDADIEDRGDFSVTDGVLRFKSPPNYELPADDDTNNEYKVTVQAQGSGSGAIAYYEIVVKVSNKEEPGAVTLSTLQPRVRVEVEASLTDPDEVTESVTDGAGGQDGMVVDADISWQWYNSDDGAVWDEIKDARSSSYTPQPSDSGKYLRAVATYNDDRDNPEDNPNTDYDESKDMASMNSGNRVIGPTTVNIAPVFENDESDARITPIDINIKESAKGGDAVGGPVAAIDDDDDTITYMISALVEQAAVDTGVAQDDETTVDETMDISAVASEQEEEDLVNDPDQFMIDRTTGQITVRPGSRSTTKQTPSRGSTASWLRPRTHPAAGASPAVKTSSG